MITQISANELKIKGISVIEELVGENKGVIVTVRGIEKYVILPLEEYNNLREYELEAAIQETKKDIAEGRYYEDSIGDHIDRISNV